MIDALLSDPQIELCCRWMCERDGVDPDETVRRVPTGEPQPFWWSYMPAAACLRQGVW